MCELGLAMNICEVGATAGNLEDIVNATLILEGGYKLLTKEGVREVLKASI